jgi:hypothetical protein
MKSRVLKADAQKYLGRGVILLALCMSFDCQGQIVLSDATVDRITSGSARFMWQTNVVGASHRIRWGLTTGNYPNVDVLSGSQMQIATGVSSGLPADQTIFAVVCSTANSVESCSNELTFQTLKRGPRPSLPEEATSFELVRPVVTGQTRLVGADCDDPNTGLLARWRSSSYGDEIVIPTTTVCTGRYIFPIKPYPGYGNWITIRSNGTLPPPGKRIDPSWISQMARINHGNPPIPDVSNADQRNCDLGRYIWHTQDPATFKLKQCRISPNAFTVQRIDNSSRDVLIELSAAHDYVTGDRVLVDQVEGVSQANGDYEVVVVDSTRLRLRLNDGGMNVVRNGNWITGGRLRKHVWVAASVTTGSSVPSTCAVNSWFLQNGTGPIRERTFWCTAPNQFQRTIIDGFGNQAAFDFYSDGASGIWLKGLYFTTIDIPDLEEYRKGFCCRNSTLTGSALFNNMVATGGTMVIYEQNLFSPHPLARTNAAVTLAGEKSAFIENWVENVNNWKNPILGTGGDSNVAALNMNYNSGGPILIRNNYLSSIGVGTIFTQDGWASSLTAEQRPRDMIITGNDFIWPEEFRVGSPQYERSEHKRMAIGRHHIEFKGCKRCQIEGNRFSSTWASANQGAAIALSSRCGGDLFNTTCVSGFCTAGLGFAKRTVGEKLFIVNKMVTVTGLTPQGFNVSPAISESGRFFSLSQDVGVYDITIRNNLFEDVTMPYYMIAPACTFNTPLPLGPLLSENNVIRTRPGFCGLDMRDSAGAYAGWSCSASCTKDFPCFGSFGYFADKSRDWTFRHNTMVGPAPGRIVPMNYTNDDYGPRSFKHNLLFEGNIVQAGILGTSGVVFGDYANYAQTMLNILYPNNTAKVAKNIWVHSEELPSSPPYGPQIPDNTLYNTTSRGALPISADYKLSTGTNTETCSGILCNTPTGRVAGADISVLNVALGKVTDAQIVSNTAQSAVLRYTSPEATACVVEWGDQDQAGTGTRLLDQPPVLDGGTLTRSRTTVMEPLTTGTTYYWRVLCPRDTVRGSFQAQ